MLIPYILIQYIHISLYMGSIILYDVSYKGNFLWFMWYCNVWDTCESCCLLHILVWSKGMNFVELKRPCCFCCSLYFSYTNCIRRDDVVYNVYNWKRLWILLGNIYNGNYGWTHVSLIAREIDKQMDSKMYNVFCNLQSKYTFKAHGVLSATI